MITSRSKWRPTNRSFMPVNLLIVGPFLPNHYCNPPDLVICTRTTNQRDAHTDGHALCELERDAHERREDRSSDDGHDDERSSLFGVRAKILDTEIGSASC